ncbi:MAG TPA: histidine phosphatase family protein [Microlunatus sp.]|nr:histidine phosphatase family protein [Microlunatus sp.]
MATDLFLVRHGESLASLRRVVGGIRGDAGLSDGGRLQGRLLEQRLRDDGFHADWLYTSALPRARETAEYVARAVGRSARVHDGLAEIRPGEADGLSIEDWRRAYPPVMLGGSEDPFAPFSPGGESWATFLTRAGSTLSRLVVEHEGERVVAVTHGGVVAASFYLAFGLGATSVAAELATENTSITHWRHEQTLNGQAAWTLVTFNDAHHLAVREVAVEERQHADGPGLQPVPGAVRFL